MIISCYSTGFAQYVVKGSIADSLGTSLYPATISLSKLSDSTIIKRVVSDQHGFVIQAPATGDYGLMISFVGYRDLFQQIHVGKTGFQGGIFHLIKKDGSMVQVVIRATIPPVIVKNDTVVYNTGAYKTRPNATVEDLLKKLPGIEVDKEGNITMQGQEVDKIYIDGKEFFLNDPRIASKNLTADMVQSVEAFDAVSDKSKFTGIKDPIGKKAINLKLKKDKKHGLFGEMYGGAGTNNVYTVGVNANSFRGDQMISAVINSNNINNLYLGNEHAGINSIPGQQVNTNMNMAYRDNWGKSLMTVINYSGNENHATQVTSSNRQTFFGDSTLLQNSLGSSASLTSNQRLYAKVVYKIDSMNTILYIPFFALQQNSSNANDSLSIVTEKSSGSYLSNTAIADNISNGHGYTMSNNISWERSFQKKCRSLFAEFFEGLGGKEARSSLYTLTRFLDSTATVNLRSGQQTNADNYHARLTYTEPLTTNHILDFNYYFRYVKNRSDKNSFDYDSQTSMFDLPDTLTTDHLVNISSIQKLSAGYNTIGEKINYQVGLSAQYSSLANRDLSRNTFLIQHFVDWYPRASLDYKLSKEQNLRMFYDGSSTNPTIDQLQPLPDLSNPLLVKIGNPLLKQQFDHSMIINFTEFNSTKLTSLLANVDVDYSVNKIVPANITLASGVQQVQYVNVNGAYNINSGISYGFSLDHNGHGNVKFNTILQYRHDISFINGLENLSDNITVGEGVDVNYNYQEKLFVETRAEINYTTSSYSIAQGQGTQLLTQQYFADIVYLLPLQFNISANYELQLTGSQGGLPGKTVKVMNAALYKNIFHDHAGEIRFSCFDIFNNNSSFSQSSGANFIATQTTNTLSRLFLLSFIYRFHHFVDPAN